MLFSQSAFLNLVPGGWCQSGESLLTVLCPWEAGVSCCLWLSTSEMAACLSSGCLWHRTGFSFGHPGLRDWCFAEAGNGGCKLQALHRQCGCSCWDAPSVPCLPSPQVALAKPCVPLSWASPVSPSLAWLCPTCPAVGSQLSCWGCLALTRMPSCRQWGQPCPNPGMPSRSKHLVLCNGRAAFREVKAGKGALCREF